MRFVAFDLDVSSAWRELTVEDPEAVTSSEFIFLEAACCFAHDGECTGQHFHQNLFEFFVAFAFQFVDLGEDDLLFR